METHAPPRLSALAGLARRPPPSLHELLLMAGGAEDYRWFNNLVREYLPGEAGAILSGAGTGHRMERFAAAFGEKFFPLSGYFISGVTESFEIEEETPWGWLRGGIPYGLEGIGWEDLHEIWDCYGVPTCLMALLPVMEEPYWKIDAEMRVSWLESAKEAVPEEVLKRIPEDGIHPALVREAVRDTEFEGVWDTVSWVCSVSGNFFIDYSHQDAVEGGYSDPWDREVIEYAAGEWRKAEKIISSMNRTAKWMEEDPPGRFAEALDFILARLETMDTEAVLREAEGPEQPGPEEENND